MSARPEAPTFTLTTASALRQEREGMRLQALQMRLYLKTTRVDSLERALSQHVAAVALALPPALAPTPALVTHTPSRQRCSEGA